MRISCLRAPVAFVGLALLSGIFNIPALAKEPTKIQSVKPLLIARPVEPDPDEGSPDNFEYKFGYVLTYPPQPGAEIIARMATTYFDRYFPFSGCPGKLTVNKVCNLQGPNGNNPIRVESIDKTSFTFVSLPGHFEGAGRRITFSFIENNYTHRLYLYVDSRGPRTAGAVSTWASGTAHGIWDEYARNLRDGIARGDWDLQPSGGGADF